LALLVTMCFQEEALSPYAAGLLMLFVGAITVDDADAPRDLHRPRISAVQGSA